LARVYLLADRPSPVAELARELEINRATLTREADRLERAGLITSERVGRQRILHPNRESPYYPDLYGLLLKALGPAQLIESAVAELRSVEQAFLIGSWAARYLGEPGPPPADVDVLLIGTPDWGAVTRMARELTDLVGREVNPTILSAEQWRDGDDGFVRQVRREPRLELSVGQNDSESATA
jgi:DNA-binding transcriptional ArsR family regulator